MRIQFKSGTTNHNYEATVFHATIDWGSISVSSAFIFPLTCDVHSRKGLLIGQFMYMVYGGIQVRAQP